MSVPPKKVTNADTGTADIVGGDDWDALSDYFNNVDKTGPAKINTLTQYRTSKFSLRNPADTFSYIIATSAIAANRTITEPLLTADDTRVYANFAQALTNKTLDSTNTISSVTSLPTVTVAKGGTGATTLTGFLQGNGTSAVTAVALNTVVTVLDRSVASQDVNTTVAETSVYSFSVPGGTLSTNRMLRLSLICDYLNNSGTTKFFTIKVKYGATTLYSDTMNTITANASRAPLYLVFLLAANNATNAQVLGGYMNLADPGGAASGIGDFADDEIMAHTAVGGSATEDSTGALTLDITITHSASDANASFRRHVATLELV